MQSAHILCGSFRRLVRLLQHMKAGKPGMERPAATHMAQTSWYWPCVSPTTITAVASVCGATCMTACRAGYCNGGSNAAPVQRGTAMAFTPSTASAHFNQGGLPLGDRACSIQDLTHSLA